MTCKGEKKMRIHVPPKTVRKWVEEGIQQKVRKK
jgi:hypothetical protein